MPLPLSQQGLAEITKAEVPRYDRSALSPGIVHFGVGNFHRAHQAVYLDTLFNAGRDHEFGLVGAGMRPSEDEMRAALSGQSYLTTVVSQSAELSEARVTGSMIDFCPVGDANAILAKLTDEATKIVSLTVTEGGYYLDAAGRFEAEHADIVADGRSLDAPRTVFGLIAAGLSRRRALGLAPFTVMSCDNIPHNGAVARAAVAGVARIDDPHLAEFIERDVLFPNAMVDRITPATGERERQILKDTFEIDDAWPVFCEDFTQWVLEDQFSAGRPAFDEAGATFVSDVAPFETMKIRILNGGHAVIAYPAGLLGITFVHDAMTDPMIAAFLSKVEKDEILPTVPPVPDTDLADYLALIIRRFANPKIGDTVRRLCLDGSNRQPKFIVPTVRDRLSAGAPVEGLALESALWCRYCFGEDESGATIAPNDPAWSELTALSQAARHNPSAWLSLDRVYGDVAAAQPFRDAFVGALHALWRDGTRAVLTRYLNSGSAIEG
ncbi:MAG: mannitol dehydrogenase family protein [Pseudomonadota bacterium]